MTTVNTTFGAGDYSGNYDPLINLSGGVQLNGAYFNNNTYLEALSGDLELPTSYTFTLSFWYKIHINASNLLEDNRPIFAIQDCSCDLLSLNVWLQMEYPTTNWTLNVHAQSTDTAQTSVFKALSMPTHDSVWHHVAIYEKSWNGTDTTQVMYLDGVSKAITVIQEYTRDTTFNFNNQIRVGAGDNRNDDDSVGIRRFEGCLDELWFTLDDFDISIADNLAKLINNSTKYPVALGAQGERPTGKAAIVYLKDEGEDFWINYGNLVVPFIVYGELPKCTLIYDDPNVDPPIPPIPPTICTGESDWDGVLGGGVYLDGNSWIQTRNSFDDPTSGAFPDNEDFIAKNQYWFTLSTWIQLDANGGLVTAVLDADGNPVRDFRYNMINLYSNWSIFTQLYSLYNDDPESYDYCPQYPEGSGTWTMYFQHQVRGPEGDAWATPYSEIGYCVVPLGALQDGNWHHIFLLAPASGTADGEWDSGGIWFDGEQVLDASNIPIDFFNEGYAAGYYFGGTSFSDQVLYNYVKLGVGSSAWAPHITDNISNICGLDQYYVSYDLFEDVNPDTHVYNFIDQNTKKPKNLGKCGQIPTGKQPIIYLEDLGEDFFKNNKGYWEEPLVVKRSTEINGVLGYSGKPGIPMQLDGAYFNGVDTKLVLGPIMTSARPKTYIMFYSFWFNTHGAPMQGEIFSGVSTFDDEGDVWFSVSIGVNNKLVVMVSEDGGTSKRMTATSSVSLPAFDTFGHHLMIDINSFTGYINVYLDDNVFTMDTVISGTPFEIGFDGWSHVFSRYNWRDGNARFRGSLGHFYLNIEENIDPSSEVNRRKFIDINGQPVYLGDFGQLPTGERPYHLFNRSGEEFRVDRTARNFGNAYRWTWSGTPGTWLNQVKLNGIFSPGIQETLPIDARPPATSYFNLKFWFRTTSGFADTTIFLVDDDGGLSPASATIQVYVDHDNRIHLYLSNSSLSVGGWQHLIYGEPGDWLKSFYDGQWHFMNISYYSRDNYINYFGGPHICSGGANIDRFTRRDPDIQDGGFFGGECWDLWDDVSNFGEFGLDFDLDVNKPKITLFPTVFGGAFGGCVAEVSLSFDINDYIYEDAYRSIQPHVDLEPTYLGDNGEVPNRDCFDQLQENCASTSLWWYLTEQADDFANNHGDSPNTIQLLKENIITCSFAILQDAHEVCSYRDFSEYTATTNIWDTDEWIVEYGQYNVLSDTLGSAIATIDATSTGGQKLVLTVDSNAADTSVVTTFHPTWLNRNDQEIIYHGIYNNRAEGSSYDKLHNCGFVRGTSIAGRFSGYFSIINSNGDLRVLYSRIGSSHSNVTGTYATGLINGDEYWIRLRAEGTTISAEVSTTPLEGLAPNWNVTAEHSTLKFGYPGLAASAPASTIVADTIHDFNICYDLEQGAGSENYIVGYTCFGIGTGVNLWTQGWEPEYSGSAELADDHATWQTVADGSSTCAVAADLNVDGDPIEQHALTTYAPDPLDYYAADQEILYEGVYHSSGVAGEATDILQNAGYVRGIADGTNFEAYVATLRYDGNLVVWYYHTDVTVTTPVQIGGIHSFTINEGDRYWIRLRAEGTTITAQVSLTDINNTEPIWNVTGTNSTITTGRVGIAGSAGGTGQEDAHQTFRYHQFAFNYAGGHAQFSLGNVNETSIIPATILLEGLAGIADTDSAIVTSVLGSIILEGITAGTDTNSVIITGSFANIILEGIEADVQVTGVSIESVVGSLVLTGYIPEITVNTTSISVTGEIGHIRILSFTGATAVVTTDSVTLWSNVGSIVLVGLAPASVTVSGSIDIDVTLSTVGAIVITGTVSVLSISVGTGQLFADPLTACGWILEDPKTTS